MSNFCEYVKDNSLEKRIKEKNRYRDALLALDGKVYAKSINSKSIRELLILYSMDSRVAKNPYLRKHAKPTLMIERIKDEWLVGIRVEDGLLRVDDLALTDNWIEELIEILMERMRAAFGCDFAITDFFSTKVEIEK